jgi:hypothetical protein
VVSTDSNTTLFLEGSRNVSLNSRRNFGTEENQLTSTNMTLESGDNSSVQWLKFGCGIGR